MAVEGPSQASLSFENTLGKDHPSRSFRQFDDECKAGAVRLVLKVIPLGGWP